MNIVKYFLLDKHQRLTSGVITKLTRRGVYLNNSSFIAKEVRMLSDTLQPIVSNKRFEEKYHVYALDDENNYYHLDTVAALRDNPLTPLLLSLG